MPQRFHDAMELADFADVLKETENVLKKCFKEYKLSEIFLSFNGGKDCTALLDITINILKGLYQEENIANQLNVIYIRTNGPFEEIETFVSEIETHYGIKLKVTEGELIDTLQRLLEEDVRLKACLMGTRRTDPYSENLDYMQKTDPSWPQIMRVSPLLDWSYHQIWSYLLQRNVPYCSLYKHGYTSIGSVKNTWPNPALAVTDESGGQTYLPAWKLQDGSLERAGRGSKQTNGSHSDTNHVLSKD